MTEEQIVEDARELIEAVIENHNRDLDVQRYLLDRAKDINAEYERKSRENAYDFNVFEITDISRLEVRMSLFLHELLKPDGKHSMGTVYLKRFFEDVLGFSTDDDELMNTQVTCQKEEYTLDGREKRIDIVIETPYRYIPIEIKINAGEGENQCYDYFFIGEKKNRNLKDKREWGLFFLTLWGNEPESTKKLKECRKELVHSVSWKEEITLWLDNVIKATGDTRINVSEVIKQYLAAVRKMTGQNQEGLQVELRELIDSIEKVKAAFAISNCVQQMKKELVRNLFAEIKNEFGSKYENLDFNADAEMYPSLGFKISEITLESVSYALVARFEISYEGTCIVGFSVSQKTEKGYKYISLKGKVALREIMSRLIKKGILDNIMTVNENWLGLLHVPDFGKNKGHNEPDFGSYNQAYYDLYDKGKYEEFVGQVVKALSDIVFWVEG